MRIERAKKVLTENTKVLYGIFGVVECSPFFPPCDFLHEFFQKGSDPCDQDSRMENGEWRMENGEWRMENWEPFELNAQEYEAVAPWWLKNHPNSTIDALGVKSWDDWQIKIIEENY